MVRGASREAEPKRINMRYLSYFVAPRMLYGSASRARDPERQRTLLPIPTHSFHPVLEKDPFFKNFPADPPLLTERGDTSDTP